MRKADRLFRIVEYLKARQQAVTAEKLATELEVSVRTIYRDVADLCNSNVPIVGEAGIGYMLDRDYIVRPLTFDVEELDALALGAQMVSSWGDREIARAARRAIDKIAAILPDTLRDEMLQTALFAPPSRAREPIRVDFAAVRRAIRTRRKLTFHYKALDNNKTKRSVRPLSLAFFGPVWLLAAWCETRQDFRNFRLDRMTRLLISKESFRDEPGKRLIDYKRCEMARQCAPSQPADSPRIAEAS